MTEQRHRQSNFATESEAQPWRPASDTSKSEVSARSHAGLVNAPEGAATLEADMFQDTNHPHPSALNNAPPPAATPGAEATRQQGPCRECVLHIKRAFWMYITGPDHRAFIKSWTAFYKEQNEGTLDNGASDDLINMVETDIEFEFEAILKRGCTCYVCRYGDGK